MTELRTYDGRADGARPDAVPVGAVPAEVRPAAVLAEVRSSVLVLLAELPAPPARIRVSAQDVAVELEWPATGAPASAAPAAAVVPVAVPVAADPPVPAAHHAVTAATVGTFYGRPEPDAPPFVAVGDAVRVGQQLAIVEAMKLMIPVESDVAGRVREVLATDGQPVEFGQPLVLIERA